MSDEEIVDAMAFLFDRMKLVVEPSGAVGVAALLAGRDRGRRGSASSLSGGNVGAARFAELARAAAEKPAQSTSTTVRSAAATSSSPPGAARAPSRVRSSSMPP